MIERYYTPQALADATGLCLSQCRTLIASSEHSICVSRNPNSKKPRYAISEKGFNRLLEAQREKRRIQIYEKKLLAQEAAQEAKDPQKLKKPPNPRKLPPGVNPDGTLMRRSQLRAAGLYKEDPPDEEC